MLSLLQYPCSMMFIPVRVIFDFKKIIVAFISNSRKNKVVYGLLIQDIEAGDLCLPDLETRLQNLKRDWIQYPWLHPDSVWATVLQLIRWYSQMIYRFHYEGNSTLNCIYLKVSICQSMSKQVLRTWGKFHILGPNTEIQVWKKQLRRTLSVCTFSKTLKKRLWRNWLCCDGLHNSFFA